jgi:hypothetical protein
MILAELKSGNVGLAQVYKTSNIVALVGNSVSLNNDTPPSTLIFHDDLEDKRIAEIHMKSAITHIFLTDKMYIFHLF